MTSPSPLLQRFTDRTATIGIVGMGYVGMPLALAAAAAGLRVVGFDIDPEKVTSINAGKSYIKHIASHDVASAVKSGLLKATDRFENAREVDAIIICVPTPLTAHREPDLSFVEQTTEAIAPHIRKDQLIVLESTTWPGTTSEVMKPILERGGLKSGKDFYLAFSPEREDPGNADFSTRMIPKVVGGDDPVALALAQALYSGFVPKTVAVSSTKTAEAVKLTENIFRAVNIALVNELKVVYDAMGIDIWEVIEAAKTKPFGFMPFYPGPGLGGHCIPIDPFYLTWKAREFEISTRFIELAGEINTAMPHYVVDRLAHELDRRTGRGLRGAKILIVGVAYKKNVEDTRESPAFKLMELIEKRGATTAFYDSYVPSIPRLREHPNFSGRQGIAFNRKTLAQFDAALIATDHDDIDYAALCAGVKLVFDTRNACARHGIVSNGVVKSMSAFEQRNAASRKNPMTWRDSLIRLRRLEAEAITIMREVVAEFQNPVMLYSIGKDSSAMLHVALKAFYPSKPPFPLLHVDTTWKFKEMIAFRDQTAARVGMDLLVHTNQEGLARGISPFSSGSSVHTQVMKTEALRQALDKWKFDAAFGGARRDEEKSRAKERIFSHRSAAHAWDPRNQRPELWSLFNTRIKTGESMRVFPLSNWTELDVWEYVRAENIPVVPLYFAKERPVVDRGGTLVMRDDERLPLEPGEQVRMERVRFRTLGCYPLTGAMRSAAATLDEVIAGNARIDAIRAARPADRP